MTGAELYLKERNMAIPEACGLWIEQRVKEELDQQEKTGNSLREIGRQVAAEVEKYFETKVNPGTILTKAARMNKSVSNETPSETPTATTDSEEIKEIKRQPAKDGTMRGGSRPGAGRKMKTDDLDDLLFDASDYPEEPGDLFYDDPVEELYEEVTEKPEQEQPAEEKTDEPQPKEEPPIKKESPARARAREEKRSHAMQFATIAISQLSRIREDDINKGNAFDKVKNWMEQNR